MAVVKDSALGSTSSSYSFNNVGGDLLIVAGLGHNAGESITGITYNGDALTKAVDSQQGNVQAYIWYLINPATGSNTVSVSATGLEYTFCQSLTGADLSDPIGDTDFTQGNGATSWEDTVTSVTGGSYAISAGRDGNGSSSLSPGTNATSIGTAGAINEVVDSSGYGDIAAGSFSIGYNRTLAGGDFTSSTVVISADITSFVPNITMI